MTFHGKLLQGGQVVLPDVRGEMSHQGAPGSLLTWSGGFDVPEGQKVEPGRYRLALDDGRSMDIVIQQPEPGPDQGSVVHFMTTGTVQIRLQRS
jgi:hypothetical protein